MILGVILLVGIVIFCSSFYSIYIKLIKSKNKVDEAISSIDVQLKKRYDLIPNILQIANKFMTHEKSLMEDIVELRTKAIKTNSDFNNINEKIKLDETLNNKLSQLMVNVENYPNLKSDQTMVTAMTTYNEVEEYISAARRFYNSAVLELNNCVEIFPSSIIANLLDIGKKDFFQIQENEKKVVNVSDYLK